MPDSSISKFFEKSRKDRLNIIANFANLTSDELNILQSDNGGISFDKADKMVENAIGTFSLPLGIATNFKINGKDYVVPMVIEEPSVIAAASKGAKIARIKGGFEVSADESSIIVDGKTVEIGNVAPGRVPTLRSSTTPVTFI